MTTMEMKEDKAGSSDTGLVTFDKPFDRDNPRDWPRRKRWTVTFVLSATGFNRIMVSTIMAPALSTLSKELHMNSVESVMALSVYLVATAFGPLLIAPLSEMYGRQPVLHATSVWFLVWNIVCGFAKTKGTLIAARLLAGFGASAIYALGGSVLADLWPPEERGQTLGLYLLVPLLGAAVGPIIGGFVVENTSWRWIFWSTSILQVVMVVLAFIFFCETHGPTILRKRAARLRQATGGERYHAHEERTPISRNLTRPVRLLIFHPIIQAQALLSGFGYGLLYLVLSTFSDLYTQQYHERISISGLHYLAICFGEIAGALLGGPRIDKVYARMTARRLGVTSPEYRVPIMLPAALLTPVGLLLYGWSAQYKLHWILVDAGAFLLSLGMQIGGQALQAYVVDSCPDHTGSASAATQFIRSLTAFGFPIFAPAMYRALGYGWGNSLLALVVAVIGLPAPLLLYRFGQRLRARNQSTY